MWAIRHTMSETTVYIKLQLRGDLEKGVVSFMKTYFKKPFHKICHDILTYKIEMCEWHDNLVKQM